MALCSYRTGLSLWVCGRTARNTGSARKAGMMGPAMRGNSQITTDMGKGTIFSRVGKCTVEAGKTTKSTAGAHLTDEVVQFIRESGKTTNSTGVGLSI